MRNPFRCLYAIAIDAGVSKLRKRYGGRSLSVKNPVSGQFLKRDRPQRSIDVVIDQHDRKSGDRFLQQISAVDQRFASVCMYGKPNHRFRIQCMSPAYLKHSADHLRQKRSKSTRKQRSAQRHRSDCRSVRIYRTSELQRQQHRRPADQRCRQKDKRYRLYDAAGMPKQRDRQKQKTRQFPIRLPKLRNPVQ